MDLHKTLHSNLACFLPLNVNKETDVSRYHSNLPATLYQMQQYNHTNATHLPPSVHIPVLRNQRSVHLIPCLCGMGCKSTLVLEM